MSLSENKCGTLPQLRALCEDSDIHMYTLITCTQTETYIIWWDPHYVIERAFVQKFPIEQSIERIEKLESLLCKITGSLRTLIGYLLGCCILIVCAAFNEDAIDFVVLDEESAKSRLLQVFAAKEDGVICSRVVSIKLQEWKVSSPGKACTEGVARKLCLSQHTMINLSDIQTSPGS